MRSVIDADVAYEVQKEKVSMIEKSMRTKHANRRTTTVERMIHDDRYLNKLKFNLEQLALHKALMECLEEDPKMVPFKDLVPCCIPEPVEFDLIRDDLKIVLTEQRLDDEISGAHGLQIDLSSKRELEKGIAWLAEQAYVLKKSPYHYQNGLRPKMKSSFLEDIEALLESWRGILERKQDLERKAKLSLGKYGDGDDEPKLHIIAYDDDGEYDPEIDWCGHIAYDPDWMNKKGGYVAKYCPWTSSLFDFN